MRLVRHPVDGTVVVDLPGKLPGRGAWVHPTAACVGRLEKQGGRLSHALKGPVQVDGLLEQLRSRVMAALLDGLSMASASGSLVGGHDQLSQALRDGRIRQVVVARDASPRTVESLRRAAPEGVDFVNIDVGREDLGARAGRGARAAVGVLPTRGAAHLSRQLRRLRDLG